MRDLKDMLKICNKATPGPWEYDSDGDNMIIKMADALGDEYPEGVESQHEIVIDIFAATDEQMIEAESNAMFIAESREFVPWAANRLMMAEKLLERLLPSLEWDVETQNPSDMKQICKNIKEFLGE